AACALSQCVLLARDDSRLTESKRKDLARAYADRAMSLLRSAVRHGFKDGAKLKKNPALDSIRSRDDFQKLLQELDASTRGSGIWPKGQMPEPLTPDGT